MNLRKTGHFLLILVFMGMSALGYAQKEVKLIISGALYVDNLRLDGVSVEVKGKGVVVSEDVSDDNGRFEVEMNLDEQYMLSFIKDDYAVKMVAIDTRNVPEKDRKFDFYNKGWKIDMIPLELNVDVSILKQPVAKLIYNSAEEQFTIDKKYEREVRAGLDKLAEDVYQAYVRMYMDAEDAFDDYMLAVKDGDLFLKEGDYENALIQYEAARDIMPNETYPEKQIKKTMALMAENADVEELYAQHLTKADEAFENEKWEESKGYYQMALDVKPKMEYPKDQIAAADLKIQLAAQAAAEMAIAERKKLYEKQIKTADSLLAANELVASKKAFNKAISMDGKQAYPKAKIKEIDSLLAQQNAAEEAYASLLANANKFFQDKKYEDAKNAYSQALGINPEDAFAQQKINEIDALLAGLAALRAKEAELAKRKEEALEKEYLSAISVADALLIDEKYAESKAEYERALTLKAGEEYPQNQIAEINAKMTALESQEAQYEKAMANAKQLEGKEQWQSAKTAYEAALAVKGSATEPKEAIGRIDAILAQLAADQAAAEKALEDQYAAYITEGDAQFESANYAGALTAYESALTLKSSETYPAEQVKKINAKLAEIEGVEKQYAKLLANAQKLDAAGSYEQAKGVYMQALELKPGEEVPTAAIAAIDAKLAQLAADKAAAQKAIDDQYAQFISTADAAFADEKYAEAISVYQQAQEVKSGETYPQDQISKANAKLAEIEGIEKQYAKLLAAAQKLEASGELLQAKSGYEQALAVKPGEQVPTEAIVAIDAKLAKLAADEAAAKQAITDQYNGYIAQADADFEAENYEAARTNYEAASKVKSTEEYPKAQMAIIADKLAAIATAKAAAEAEAKALAEKEAKYQEHITKGDAEFAANQWEAAKAAYVLAKEVDPDKVYPSQQIAVIDEKLAALAAELAAKEQAAAEAKAQEDAYQAAIKKADEWLAAKEYEQAKQGYLDAKKIKPEANYPDTKIDEIDAAVAAAAAAAEAAEAERQRLAAVEAEFTNLMNEGEDLEKNNALTNAKYKYEAALKLKPGNPVATAKLREIAIKIEEARKLAEFHAKNDTEFNRQLARDYPNGLNETKTEGSKTVTRIVIVANNRGDEYRKEKYNYGAVFYFKNGKKIDATTFQRETKGH